MTKLPYFSLLKKSFLTIWQNKYLLLFGFFAGGSVFYNINFFNFNFSQAPNKETNLLSNDEIFKELIETLHDHLTIVIIVLAGLFVLCLIIYFLHLIAKIALVQQGLQIKQNVKQQSFSTFWHIKNSFKNSLNYFWKVLFLDFIFFLLNLLIISVFVLPYFNLKNLPVFSLFFVMFTPILIFISFVFVGLVYTYALRIIIQKKEKVFKSIHLAFLLLKKFWGPSLITWLTTLVLKITQVFTIIVSAILIIIPFAILGFILFLLFQKIGLIIGIILGSAAIFTVIILYQAIWGSFFMLYWTYIFKEIRKKQ